MINTAGILLILIDGVMRLRTFIFALLTMIWVTGCGAVEKPERKVEMMCGGYKWTIVCGRDNTPKERDPRECNKNVVTVTDPHGEATIIKDPPVSNMQVGGRGEERQPMMFDATTPDLMQCVPINGQYFVRLGYSLGVMSAGMFVDAFSASGTRFTSVTVPINKGYKDPAEMVSYRNLPLPIRIEEE